MCAKVERTAAPGVADKLQLAGFEFKRRGAVVGGRAPARLGKDSAGHVTVGEIAAARRKIVRIEAPAVRKPRQAGRQQLYGVGTVLRVKGKLRRGKRLVPHAHLVVTRACIPGDVPLLPHADREGRRAGCHGGERPVRDNGAVLLLQHSRRRVALLPIDRGGAVPVVVERHRDVVLLAKFVRSHRVAFFDPVNIVALEPHPILVDVGALAPLHAGIHRRGRAPAVVRVGEDDGVVPYLVLGRPDFDSRVAGSQRTHPKAQRTAAPGVAPEMHLTAGDGDVPSAKSVRRVCASDLVLVIGVETPPVRKRTRQCVRQHGRSRCADCRNERHRHFEN